MVRTIMILVLLACSTAYSFKFIVYGDTRDGIKVNRVQAAQMDKENPSLVLNVGDVWGNTSKENWMASLIVWPKVSGLLNSNNFLVSRGNHESFSQLSSFKPTLLRGNTERYAFRADNCFFVCMGMEPYSDYKWLREQLASEASRTATWRFVYHHYPIYSSFGLYSDGVKFSGSLTLYRNLCDTFKVTASFYGHAHGYLRTKIINNGAAVSVLPIVNITANPGTVYMLTGGGGAPLDGVSKPAWWTAYQDNKIFFITIIDAGPDTCSINSKDTSGKIFDQLKIFYDRTNTLLREPGKVASKIPEAYYFSSKLYITTPYRFSSIKIFSINGILLRTFSSEQAGKYSLKMDLGPGVYTCRIESSKEKFIEKFVVK